MNLRSLAKFGGTVLLSVVLAACGSNVKTRPANWPA